ncbi:lactonase family protein [Mucilaginibacter sp. Bleaf8]|uniref:lactonase family protein n=1 Tax=Mucilaginibacter sp. Bleaf8 TaxID=2834430 RepID=UPI001BD12FEB|nr:lactonase family protein [Mucilaginibacter sp. Bleaf8]MBS7566628.1 lactonase family protein [Mucilaginibacter sp. Bleaf8]
MKKTLILMAMLPFLAKAQPKPPKSLDLLIGTYTSGESKGIYVYRFYTESGRLAYLNEADGVDNPSYLCVSPDRKFVYSVNEASDERKGGASAFSFEAKTGKLTFLNKQSTGAAPCFISIDKAQKNVFTADYGGGSVSVFLLNADGSLKPASQTLSDRNQPLGPNKERQEKPHVHMASLTPDEKFLLYTDLGTDKLNIQRYKASQTPVLTPATPASVSVEGGDGPRHWDFSADRKHLYLITEMTGKIYAYHYNGGKPKPFQSVSIVPDGYTGQTGAADLHVSPDGRFLYATNRGDANEIVVFAIDQESGQLTLVERQSTLGSTPRNFVIDPTGSYMLVANQHGNSVIVFKVDKTTGKLKLTNNRITVDSPVCLKFTTID